MKALKMVWFGERGVMIWKGRMKVEITVRLLKSKQNFELRQCH